MPPSISATAPDPPIRPVTGRARARLVPGGYDITRLPLTVPPAAGEQLASWLARLAHRYRLPVSGLLSELGVPVVAGPAVRVEAHLSPHVQTLATAAGLDHLPPGTDGGEDPLSAQVARYLGAYHGRGKVAPDRTRYCPSCLAETGGIWQQAWAAPLNLVCTTHRRLLVRRCPACHRARFTSSAWMTHDTAPWVCSEPPPGQHTPRTRYQVCGHDLRETTSPPMGQDVAALQAWLHALARQADNDPAHVTRACGIEVPHADLFDAALELVVERLGDVKHLTRPGRAARDLLDAVLAAREVITQPDPATAGEVADRHGLLHPTGPVTPIGPDHVLTKRRHNPLLAAVRLISLSEHLPAGSQLVFRTGSDHPRYPCPTQHGAPTPAPGPARLAWIPQLLWPGTLHPWIRDSDYRDRAAASMLLAKVGSTRPWRLIAIDLGLPASFAVHPPNLVRHLRRTGAWPSVLRRLDEVATLLEATVPPIDYQTRRWIAADQDLLVAAVNHTRSLLGPCHGWVSTSALVELFWSVYTGGDLRLATPTAGTLLNPDLYHRDDEEGAHTDPTADPDLARFLAMVAAAVAEATGHNPGEPLAWRPP